MEKVNFPENCFFNVNQAYLTIQKSQKIFYGDYFILGQVIEAANSPCDIEKDECWPNKVKMVCPIYDIKDGAFKGIVETLGFIVVCGNDNETFLNYGFDKEKSKLLSIFSSKNTYFK